MTAAQAYAADVAARPTYHNGKPRPAWEDLPPQVQHEWNEYQPKPLIGPEVAAARIALGWTRREAARRLGYASENSLRRIEAGATRMDADRAAWLVAAAEWMRENPPPSAFTR